MSPFMFSNTSAQRPSQLPNHQPPVTDRTPTTPTAPAPHRRATSEPVNKYPSHKFLPRLPHEIEPYRSRSLPARPSAPTGRRHAPRSKYAPAVPPYRNRPLPPPPLLRKRESRTAETLGAGSEILLLTCEGWEGEWALAEIKNWWAEGTRFAHEVMECACDCACGMV